MLMTNAFAKALHMPLATAADWILGGSLCCLVPTLYGYVREKQLYRQYTQYIQQYRDSNSTTSNTFLMETTAELSGKPDVLRGRSSSEKKLLLADAGSRRLDAGSSWTGPDAGSSSGGGGGRDSNIARGDIITTTGSSSSIRSSSLSVGVNSKRQQGSGTTMSGTELEGVSPRSGDVMSASSSAAAGAAASGPQGTPGAATAAVADTGAAMIAHRYPAGPFTPLYRSPLVRRSIAVKVRRSWAGGAQVLSIGKGRCKALESLP
jgi:hypothetical protein